MADEKTIAVIGASSDPGKWSHKAILAYQRAGWRVYPVNPYEPEVLGLKSYATVRDIPAERLDRVSLYLAPERGLKVLEDIASKRIGEFYVNPGAESEELIARARQLGLEPILACSILAI